MIKSFDKLRTNGNGLSSFVVSLSNALLSRVKGHERKQRVEGFLRGNANPSAQADHR